MSYFATLVKPQAVPIPTAIAQRSMTVCAHSIRGSVPPAYFDCRSRCSYHKNRSRVRLPPAGERLEEIFIRSLVTAGSCRQVRHWGSSPSGGKRPRHVPFDTHGAQTSRQARRCLSNTGGQHTAIASAQPEISKQDYEKLANTYPDFRQPWLHRKTKYKRSPLAHLSLAPRLVLTPNQEFRPVYGTRIVLEPDDEFQRRVVAQLKRSLLSKLGHIPLDKLWELWENLPMPRPRYLDDKSIERFFRHLTWVELRDRPGHMQRFLTLLDECTNEELPLSPAVWNSAISFAGRWTRKVSSREIKRAVEMWMRMEKADCRANTATFNILFDVAIRSGRFALADMIFNELKMRDLAPDRYSRTALIYYAGLKGDGDAVRQAFQDFVDADEIVDTAVMNIVITALLKAGEAPAAENVFYKMKALHEKKFGAVPPSSWQEQKKLGKLLKNIGARLRRERAQHESSFFGGVFSTSERRDEIQDASPIAPDAGTYRLLIQHHVYTAANLQRTNELVAEMKERQLHVHGSIYYHILCGYCMNAGSNVSAWTLRSLEEVWSDVSRSIVVPVPERLLISRTANADADPDTIPNTRTPASATASNDPIIVTTAEAPSLSHRRGQTESESGEEEASLSELAREPYYTTALAIAALRAFHYVAGHQRMMEVWHEIMEAWKDVTDDERARIEEEIDGFRVPRATRS